MMTRKRHVTIAATIATLCVASSALAQGTDAVYRDGQPTTLNGAAERRDAALAEPATVAANFKAAYANAGRPKVALLWHRQLDDSISASREATAQVTSQGALPRHNYDVTIKV